MFEMNVSEYQFAGEDACAPSTRHLRLQISDLRLHNTLVRFKSEI